MDRSFARAPVRFQNQAVHPIILAFSLQSDRGKAPEHSVLESVRQI